MEKSCSSRDAWRMRESLCPMSCLMLSLAAETTLFKLVVLTSFNKTSP